MSQDLGYPLADFDWYYTAARTFIEPHHVRLLTIQENGSPIAIAPLCITTEKTGRYLELIGARQLGEPAALLYRDQAALARLIAHLNKLKHPVRLNKMRADLLPPTAFNKQLSIKISRQATPSPHVPIDTDWQTFAGTLSSKRRYDLRRARNRAEKIGAVEFTILTPTPEQLPAHLETAFQIEANSWKGRQGSALAHNPKLARFFKTYTQSASQKGRLRLGFMTIAEQPISMLIGIQANNTFWVLKTGYDEQYAPCSPGIQLMHQTIQYAFEQNLKSIEFLGSAAPWLTMWARENQRENISYGIYPLNPGSLYSLGREVLNKSLQKI